MRGEGGRRRRTLPSSSQMEALRPNGTSSRPPAPFTHPRSVLFLTIAGLALFTTGIIVFLLRSDTPHAAPHSDLADRFHAGSPQCFKAPLQPGDRRRNKDTLKVVNFNAEWLFLYGGRGGIHCPTDACPWGNVIEAMNHFKDVADTLAKIDADIIHLSEVEDCRSLRTLLTLFPTDHGYSAYLILGKDHATGQNTALLTRVDLITDMIRTNQRTVYPVENSRCGSTGRGTIGVSKHYVASMMIENGQGIRLPFIFTGLHFLARPGDKFRCSQREAQATVLRNFVQSYTRNNEMLIIMGDFNDYDPRALGTDGRKPISEVLNIVLQSSGSKRTLLNAAALIPVSERYSCWFDVNQNCRVDGDKEKVMIDHILYDSTLQVIEAKIHHDYNPTCEKRVSDHWPFSVTFNLSRRAGEGD